MLNFSWPSRSGMKINRGRKGGLTDSSVCVDMSIFPKTSDILSCNMLESASVGSEEIERDTGREEGRKEEEEEEEEEEEAEACLLWDVDPVVSSSSVACSSFNVSIRAGSDFEKRKFFIFVGVRMSPSKVVTLTGTSTPLYGVLHKLSVGRETWGRRNGVRDGGRGGVGGGE